MKAVLSTLLLAPILWWNLTASPAWGDDRPNILVAISDDQSYPHASVYGAPAISTSGFDRVAKEGVLFNKAFAASPGCSPSRAALLTGRQHWQLEHAGTHASSFSTKFETFPDLLEKSGYFVGYTGKGWGPGNWKISGRTRNPAGPEFDDNVLKAPNGGISNKDYAGNFRKFLSQKEKGQPFCFWYGGHEPHRKFAVADSEKHKEELAKIVVPPFLPDTPEIRADLFSYYREIEWFDRHLAGMLNILEESGELDNTLIIVTSDNGMSFPRAKANCYEYGIHVPLAIRWGSKVKPGRAIDDLVGFVDLTATILQAAQVAPPSEPAVRMEGNSLLEILTGDKQGLIDAQRRYVYAGRERHSSSRYKNLGYPQRAIRSQDYLFIRNFKPDRWPAGSPQKFEDDGTLGPPHGGYHDIDAAPSLTFLVENRDDEKIKPYFEWSVNRRPAEELYNVREDPGCLVNLIDSPMHSAVLTTLRSTLQAYLQQTQDPRVGPEGDIFETYERFSPIRKFPAPQ